MEDGVLHAGPEQPIRGRDGRHASWMFYSWNCSLTGRGAELAGRLILDKLKSFDSRQLATFGYTGVPLMAAAILQGDDRYTGLVIREARKVHGASRQIDGPADKSRPVVVIDDSIELGHVAAPGGHGAGRRRLPGRRRGRPGQFPLSGRVGVGLGVGLPRRLGFRCLGGFEHPEAGLRAGTQTAQRRKMGRGAAARRSPPGNCGASRDRALSAHRDHADAAAALGPRGRRARRRLCQLSRALQRPPAGARGLLAFRSGGRRPLPRLGAGDGQDPDLASRRGDAWRTCRN